MRSIDIVLVVYQYVGQFNCIRSKGLLAWFGFYAILRDILCCHHILCCHQIPSDSKVCTQRMMRMLVVNQPSICATLPPSYPQRLEGLYAENVANVGRQSTIKMSGNCARHSHAANICRVACTIVQRLCCECCAQSSRFRTWWRVL